MKILILGATGFIGSAVAARLVRDGHHVTGLGRDPRQARHRQPGLDWIAADLAKIASPADWLPLLRGQQAVVNCAGALQDGLSDNLAATQERAMLALYSAAGIAKISMIVQISARTDGTGGERPFLATKRRADRALAASGIPHVILRPALVIGRNAHGGTALLRALAALPAIIPLAYAEAPVAAVSLYDVADAVAAAIGGELGTADDIDLADSPPQSLADLVALHRRWLGLPPARIVAIPAALARPVSWLADLAGRVGWRSPLRSTAMAVMSEGVIGSGASPLGRPLTPVTSMLTDHPSAVQDLWFARLYLMKPLAIGGLSLFWLLSGLIPLLDPDAASRHFLPFMSGRTAFLLLIATCLIDIALGCAVVVRPYARMALIGMITVSLGYLAGGTLLEPSLWLDPLGPLVKVLPSLLLTLMTLAILEER